MKRFKKIALMAMLAQSLMVTSSFAATTNGALANVTPAERAKIEAVVHDYLINNPQVIVEVIQTLQRKQYEQAEQTVKKTQQIVPQFANALFHQANDPVAGNKDGSITVVEFFDYQCPHCVDMAPIVDSIIKANPNVRFVFKEFPIRGPVSEFAAKAALAANMQGKYYEFSHALLAAAKQKPLTQDMVLEVAKSTGLNVDQLKKDMDGEAVAKQLKANIQLAKDLKLFGTPAIFIGKTKDTKITYVPGEMNQDQLKSAIDTASK